MSDTNDSAALIAAAQKNLAQLGTSATAAEIDAIATISTAQATVAIAYEQRTANLLAMHAALRDRNEHRKAFGVLEVVNERLGL